MKKNVYLFIMFIFGIHIIQAKPITPLAAKSLAISYYTQHSAKVPQTLTLAYTETSPKGEALYYVFNVNTNDGFVIVTADDATHPIIGYSTENQFVTPEEGNNFDYWMKSRKNEIMAIKSANLPATTDITREWAGDFSATSNLNQRNNGANSVTATNSYTVGTYLVQSLWNQNPYYNKLCPGGAVTGCVATAMAQIMKYWSYPTKGVGSHSYCDCTPTYSVNNGTLTVNFASNTYVWTAMPLTGITNSNVNSIANLMYDLGVSVNMNYSPSGSGAYVLAADNGICAQTSYTNYFGYNSSTIQGYERTLNSGYAQSGYADPAWINLLKTDINAGRPVQYAGYDPSQGGHTWVCDGYDASNNFHMNWGWGGSSNGWFSINNLNTGFNPSANHQILVGIQLPPTLDAGITSVVAPTGILCVSTFTPVVTLRNFGQNTLTACTINYQLDGGTVQTYNWTGSLATGSTANVNLPAVTTTVGSHTLTSSTTGPNSGTDGNTTNDQTSGTFAYNTIGAALPLMEGFEGGASLPANWSTSNATTDISWQVVTNVAHTGNNSVGLNNCTGDGGTDMTGFKEWLYTPTYDFSSSSSASISFDVGYVPAYDSANAKLYTDSLAAYYSTNCGSTWTQFYYKGGTALSTAPAFTLTPTGANCVAPTSNQWRTETNNLSSVLGQSNVEFAFKNISGWGNWIYVDNINITSVNTTGISTLNNKGGINIYPNPAHNNLFINTAENTSSISVTDIIGQTVISDLKVTPQQTQNIDISNLADGVYLIKVNSSDNQVKVIRFIKN
jgi:hypothetical protein